MASSAFNLGVLGMLSQSDSMSIIGNNIANSKTVAFKASTANFAELFVSHSGQLVNGIHNQFGNGVTLSGVTSDWSPGAVEDTANEANIAIEGEGFMAVQYPDQSTIYYTRAGDFALVQAPTSVNNGTGYVLMRPNGVILNGCYNTDSNTVPAPTSLDLNAADGTLNVDQQPIYFLAQKFDDGTMGHAAAGWYEWDDTDWTVANGAVPSPTSFNITSEGIVTAEPSGPDAGYEVAGDTRIELRISRSSNSKPVDAGGNVLVDDMLSARIAIQRFNNPDSLEHLEGGMYNVTAATSALNVHTASGSPKASLPNSNGCGRTRQGMLEQSNVDLVSEFTDMIVTQRSFQANSKTITTADQMLQTVLALKQ